MFSRFVNPALTVVAQSSGKCFSTSSQRSMKVTVAGAAGGIGQPLSLLLKMNPLVSHLALYDVANVTPGVGVDLSHMNTPAKVTGHKGTEELKCAVEGSNLIVVPAGVPRKPGMTRDDLFNTNASIVTDIAKAAAEAAPNAILAIITNPVNSVVPIACEVLAKCGKLDPRRVIGVTTLDVVRACAFIGDINCIDPRDVTIPVIGGHSGVTIIPLLSRACPQVKLTDQAKIEALTKRIQEAGTEVVNAKAGGGSATLSMAFAAARFSNSVLRGLNGEKDVIECGYVQSKETEATYFANPLLLGKNGVEKNLGIGDLNDYEKGLLKAALPELKANIEKGVKFAQSV